MLVAITEDSNGCSKDTKTIIIAVICSVGGVFLISVLVIVFLVLLLFLLFFLNFTFFNKSLIEKTNKKVLFKQKTKKESNSKQPQLYYSSRGSQQLTEDFI